MAHPHTKQMVSVSYEEGVIRLVQMQPNTFLDHVNGTFSQQNLNLSLESAAVLSIQLAALVAEETKKLNEY